MSEMVWGMLLSGMSLAVTPFIWRDDKPDWALATFAGTLWGILMGYGTAMGYWPWQ